jgi:hypothetical protein
MYSYDSPDYAAWGTAVAFGGADSSHSGDPDNDGISNFVEYALGFEPTGTNNSAQMPQLEPVTGTNNFVFAFDRMRDASQVTYTIQTSTNLINWTDVAVNPGLVGSRVYYEFPIPSGSIFVRLKVNEL